MEGQEAGFIVYPAIDLRAGQVVRLMQGDPARQTAYGNDPGSMALRWLDAGAKWLHVVNLDGAFGEPDQQNRSALRRILEVSAQAGAQVQFGGGLRSLADIEGAFLLGVNRVILGTVAVEAPELAAEALQRYGSQRVGLGLDARQGKVQVRGWQAGSALDALTLGKQLFDLGFRLAVYTDVDRDGAGSGVDASGARLLAQHTGLDVIASGGVAALEDVRLARHAGLKGVIIGRALYDGRVSLQEAFTC